MSEINIETIYEHVTFEFEYTSNILRIMWDPTNLVVNEIMVLERSVFSIHYKENQKVSCCWVYELKRVLDWKSGEVVYLQGILYKDGLLEIAVSSVSNGMDMIDENGYLLIRDFKCNGDGYYSIGRKKCDCIYNDLLDESYLPYTLK